MLAVFLISFAHRDGITNFIRVKSCVKVASDKDQAQFCSKLRKLQSTDETLSHDFYLLMEM